MASGNPVLIVAVAGQDVQVTVTLSSYPSGGITSWTTSATMRAYAGGPVLATGTVAVTTDSNPTAVFTITFAAADLTQEPGAYIWDFERTDTGGVYKIIDTSGFRIETNSTKAYPTLTNLSELWTNLGYNPSTIDDNRYKKDLQILCAAEAFVHRHCGRRKFWYGTYTEYLDAPLRSNLFVRETPIWSITSITYDGQGGYGQLTGSFASTGLLTAGSDYYFVVDDPDGKGYRGEIITTRVGGWGWWFNTGFYAWGRGYTPGLMATRPMPTPGAFKVVYIGGYAVIPDDLKLAVWQIVADRRAAALVGNVMQSEGMEGYSYSLGAPDAEIAKIGSVASILAGYKRGESYFA